MNFSRFNLFFVSTESDAFNSNQANFDQRSEAEEPKLKP